jgi:predicted NAD/FAD-binding protein
VFNDRTYPNLIRLFEALGIESAASDMSFSVRIGAGEVEWAGTNLASVFAQPANLVNPRFLRMLRDLVRFNREATRLAESGAPMRGTLGDFLDEGGYGQELRGLYLLPMAACIWSTPSRQINRFPLQAFVDFCHNHGLLALSDRPQWRSVRGGGREYVQRLARDLPDVRLATPVLQVRRDDAGVDVGARAAHDRPPLGPRVEAEHAVVGEELDQEARRERPHLVRVGAPHRRRLRHDQALDERPREAMLLEPVAERRSDAGRHQQLLGAAVEAQQVRDHAVEPRRREVRAVGEQAVGRGAVVLEVAPVGDAEAHVRRLRRDPQGR